MKLRRGLAIAVSLAATAQVAAARTAQGEELLREFGDAAREHLAEPGTLERIAEHALSGRLARLIEDLHLQFKVFEDASGSGDAALGFSYDFAKSLSSSDDHSSGSTEFIATGNVAFDQETNPDDFLVTTLRLRWFGTHAFGGGQSRKDEVEQLPDPDVGTLAAFDPQRFAELAERFAQLSSSAEIRADPDFQALAESYFEGIEKELPPELIWDFDLHASYESNQDFSSRQPVLGTSLGGRLVSWDPEASLSRWNVFDWPAAALRWLAGQDESFRASGQTYPTIVSGLDLVDATADDTRSAITDDESFLRARVEAGFRSRVFELDEQALFLSAGWRFYGEIDPPAAVQRADADQFSHLQLQLDLPKGWSLTYATGKLPLDAENDSTFALGFQVHF